MMTDELGKKLIETGIIAPHEPPLVSHEFGYRTSSTWYDLDYKLNEGHEKPRSPWYGGEPDLRDLVRKPKLQRAQESRLRELRVAAKDRLIEKIFDLEPDDDLLSSILAIETHSFVINHDWYAMVGNTGGFWDGDFRTPFSNSCFEFKVHGFHLIVLVQETEKVSVQHKRSYFVQREGRWFFWNFELGKRGLLEIASVVQKQIRAVCIMLDSELAVTEVVRSQHLSNEQRQPPQAAPFYDYHTVRLADRRRYLPNPDNDGSENHARKRLHFVREHDRHFATSKTRVRWHYRGDPELGWVEKHYEL